MQPTVFLIYQHKQPAIQRIAISSHDQLLVNNSKGLLFAGFTLFGTFLKLYVQVRVLCKQPLCKQA